MEGSPSDFYAVTGRFTRRVRAPCTRRTRRLMLLDMAPSRPSAARTEPAHPVDAARLEAALVKVAVLVTQESAFAPVFERLEAELAAAMKNEKRLSEAQRRARALLAQKAMRVTSSATCSNDAPLPHRSRSSR